MAENRRILLFAGRLEVGADEFDSAKLKYERSIILNVALMRDDKKMYVVVQDPAGLIMRQRKEMWMFIK